jgi:GNAT superfamily N-acetyltransferase
MPTFPRIRWCNDPERASELARFFCSNAEPDYISHGELMGPRALSPQRWRPGLARLLEQEIEPRLRAVQNSLPPDDNSSPTLVVENGQELVGLAFVTFEGDAPHPFAVVEDLLVDAARRGSGLGKAILDWITSEALARNCRRLFIECGERNFRAHRFFAREGFATTSVVMMKCLTGPP